MTKETTLQGEIAKRESGTDLSDMTPRTDMTSAAAAEVQGSILMAMQFPRNENDSLSRMQQAVARPAFRDKAIYRYPRGGTEISGPSVHLARTFARCWGNLRYGFEVVAATDDRMQVRGFAWDMETNMRASQDASFKCLVYRKHAFGKNKPGWVAPDERDLRELVNKHGAICERNCLLKVLPFDLIDEIVISIEQADRKHVTNDLESSRRKIVAAFGVKGIVASQLETYLGRPLNEATPDDVVSLRGIWKSIDDGNSTWSEHVGSKSTQATGKVADLLGGSLKMGAAAEPDNSPRAVETSPKPSDESEPVGVTGDVGYSSVRQGIRLAMLARDEVDEINETSAFESNPMRRDALAYDAFKHAFLYGADSLLVEWCAYLDCQTSTEGYETVMRDSKHATLTAEERKIFEAYSVETIALVSDAWSTAPREPLDSNQLADLHDGEQEPDDVKQL